MQYLLCKKQDDEGCGNTIGCGMVFEFVEFDGTPEDVEGFFERHITHPGGSEEQCDFDYDGELQEVFFLPAETVVQIDIGRLRQECEQEEQDVDDACVEAAERVEYERLRKKFVPREVEPKWANNEGDEG